MGKIRYLDHESHQREWDEKLVKVIMDKVIQIRAGLNHEFMSCLLEYRLQEPMGALPQDTSDSSVFFLREVFF